VAVLRIVAAADMPAAHAEAEVNPLVSHRQALLTAVGGARLDVFDRVEMTALHPPI